MGKIKMKIVITDIILDISKRSPMFITITIFTQLGAEHAKFCNLPASMFQGTLEIGKEVRLTAMGITKQQ